MKGLQKFTNPQHKDQGLIVKKPCYNIPSKLVLFIFPFQQFVIMWGSFSGLSSISEQTESEVEKLI